MLNPFLVESAYDKTEYLTPRCSLNRAILAKVPVSGIEDGIEGKSFTEIFSTNVIVEEMRRMSGYYALDFTGIPDSALPMTLDKSLVSEDVRYHQLAERIIQKLGNRLGLILLALKQGSPENRAARPDWDESCWDFWRQTKKIIFTGGLGSGMLGRRFKEQIQYVFDYAGEKPYHIRIFDNGTYLGIMGTAQRMMADNSESLVMDLGQTYFKRAVVKKTDGIITGFSQMDSLPSRYMQSAFEDEGDKLAFAYDLHNYIVNILSSSYREALMTHDLDSRILISIANYTYSGFLNESRGGYAKLSLLADNYADMLEEELSGELRREVHVRLVHDGTATALYFGDEPDAVCITLGTGFGVGYPAIRL